MKAKWLDALVLVYGALLIGLGLEAYLAKQSLPSLLGGGGLGLAAIFFAAFTSVNPRVGRIGAAVVTLLTLGRFVPALLKEPKWSNIVLVVASLIVFGCLGAGHMLAMKAKRNHADPASE